MEQLLAALPGGLGAGAFAFAVAVAVFAGFVKGALGFAMPLIMISGLAAIVSPPVAVAALVLPTLITNTQQAFRDGPAEMWASVVKYRRMIVMVVLFIAISAQFVLQIPTVPFLLLLGVPVTAFALVQLAGRDLRLQLRHRVPAEYALGVVGGLYGGVSGIWGPPLLVYLVSTDAPKREAVRVQGVVFLLGAVAMLGAHLASGVINAQTLPLSAALVVPAVAGMLIGMRLQDRLDPLRFRWWTLVLLALTGANLIRQAMFG